MSSIRFNICIGGALVAVMSVAALLSVVWTPYDHTVLNVANKFAGPSGSYWLGTDQLGRDQFTLLMIGARTSISMAILAVGLGAIAGTCLGVAAAAIGGLVEDAIMRLADFTIAFPAILVAIMLAAAYGPSLSTTIIAIASISLPTFTRVSRAAARQVWTQEYTVAARAGGRSLSAITWNHVLPNIQAVLLVQATIDIATAILAEAALSYLGLGVQPPDQSWGRMLADAQTLIYLAPSLAILPGLCMVASVMGFALLGDGLRDLNDPKLRNETR
ncbi:Dipeptide transport system permease protein DppC [Candidatus Rhodobacter oscarellae]|uniref:Dipeptide transport system permease protein DppC n=1 Tax=Candidatus Rhodobacter oscarellae TaxID=1675527 RepID=A0A0J9E6M8_9RHOB|nr:ABC transporter permease [Candidatus Rhodobacter lobularis]KMW58430.1 Dipeptide transport system permease protein DppC [Candidatus Rhodobacter lobularis]